MMITKIKKRNGEVVTFDRKHIEDAIRKACSAVGSECDFVTTLTDDIVNDIEATFYEHGHEHVPTVEYVQDCVERHLVKINEYEVAKAYILYRDKRAEEREERRDALVEQFEKRSLKVEKANGRKEKFDLRKIKKVFDRSAHDYADVCHFEDFVEAFKRNLVEGIKTSDINKLMVKACIDLVTINNTQWQHVAARISLGNLYKQAKNNRGAKKLQELYTPESYKALMDEYIAAGLYYKDFYKYYSEDDIREAGRHLSFDTDHAYEYTTILSLAKRYLLKHDGKVKELPQEMYMSVALFLAIPEPDESRLAFALKIYEHCSQQRISLPTPTLLNSRTNYHQLSSCFKINIDDDLRAIYHGIENMAQI